MKLIKLILFIIGVAIAIVIVGIVLVTLMTLLEDLLEWLGVPNVGKAFHMDDIYRIMGE